MIVTTDEGSDYSSPPLLTLEWDATSGALEEKLQHLHVADIPDDDSAVHRRRLSGQKIQTYMSVAGGQSFTRWKIEIPLGEREEEVFYHVNGGPESSFWVPARDQDLRVMVRLVFTSSLTFCTDFPLNSTTPGSPPPPPLSSPSLFLLISSLPSQ